MSTREAALLDVFFHEDVLLHDTGHGVFEAAPSALLEIQMEHPENAGRIRNMRSILERGPVSPHLEWHEGRSATADELALYHDPDYVAQIREAAQSGHRFTATTVLKPGAWSALSAAAGTTIAAGRCTRDLRRPAFALVRPPGHHAARAVADGYCFFNHVGIAAEDARSSGLSRIAIIDWDVHHGNGTQEGFYDRSDVLTISMHMDHGAWGPTHPQTGAVDEIGIGAGAGFNLNIPLPMGSTNAAYLRAFAALISPRIRRFRPALIIIAHGVDASQFDPGGRQLLTMSGFHSLARAARDLADECCEGRLLIVQEGGYNLAYSAFCVHAAMEGFCRKEQSLLDPLAYMPQFDERSARDVSDIESRVQRGAQT